MGTTLGEERQVGDLSDRWNTLGNKSENTSGAESVDPEFFARSDNQRLASVTG